MPQKQIFIILFILIGSSCFGGSCLAEVTLTEQKLAAPDGESLDKFGHAVAISGNFAIVGAYGDDDNGDASGSAYIFFHNGTTWEYKQKLTVAQGQGLEKFGFSVDISGNMAIVGAFGNNGEGSPKGAAYIFSFDGSNWIQTQILVASDGLAWDSFGQAVSISGQSALVGAPGRSSFGDSSGCAYLFTFNGTTWDQGVRLAANDAAGWDRFGQSVSLFEDVAVIGAPGDNDNGKASGSAYIFSFDGSNWAQTEKLKAIDGSGWDKFGQSVDISQNSLVIGAPGVNQINASTGAAYLFSFDGNSWLETQKIIAADGLNADFFGHSVAIYENLIAVGAYGADTVGISSGSAYIFSFDEASWKEESKVLAKDGIASDYFGQSVALSKDFLLVGAYGNNDQGKTAGTAFTSSVAIYINNSPVITSLSSITVPETSTDVLTVEATDEDLDTVAFSLSGGADLNHFSIHPVSGALTFSSLPDFENPGDSDANNTYYVQVTVSDGKGGSTAQDIIVTVSATTPPDFIDDDGDGIDDWWELNYAESLSILGVGTDFDNDGYTDLQEYLNWLDHESDPEDNLFDPVNIQNVPGDTGYKSPKNNFWILVLPAILNAAGR